MGLYEYTCHDCKLIWEQEHPIAEKPMKTECPDCGEMCGKDWRSDSAPSVHFVGDGWMTKGGGHLTGSSDELNLAMQEGCKKRMDKGYEAYKHYSPSQGYIESVGARRLNHEEVQNKLKASKEMSAKIYDNIGIDPHKQNYKPQ